MKQQQEITGRKPEVLFDRRTGEILDRAEVDVIAVSRRARRPGGFVMAEQEAFAWIASNVKNGTDSRVFIYLISVLDFENWVRVSQADVGRKLGIDRHMVNKSFRRLRELGVLEHGKVGSTFVYRISPHVAWKGRESSRQEVLRDGWLERGFTVVDPA